MTDLTNIPQFTVGADESLAPASANWGTVYQNYISVNLSSDDLMKGAYDAYNLLSAGKLSRFQGNVITYVNDLINNQKSLAGDLKDVETQLTTTVANLNRFFNSEEGGSISSGTTSSAVHKLAFPSNDSFSKITYYDLSKGITIPFATEGNDPNEPETNVPGLIKGFSAGRLAQIIPLFNTAVNSQFVTTNFFTETYTSESPQDGSYLQPIELLVWQINNLQYQVKQLQSTINGIYNGTVSLGDVKVKTLTFEDGTTTPATQSGVINKYIVPGQFQTTDKGYI